MYFENSSRYSLNLAWRSTSSTYAQISQYKKQITLERSKLQSVLVCVNKDLAEIYINFQSNTYLYS